MTKQKSLLLISDDRKLWKDDNIWSNWETIPPNFYSVDSFIDLLQDTRSLFLFPFSFKSNSKLYGSLSI